MTFDSAISLAVVFLTLWLGLSCGSVWADGEISRSFEFTYASKDPAANGVTDFKGETEILDTSQRVEFLHLYGKYAKKFYDDPHLDKKVVSQEEVDSLVDSLKDPPLPEIRTRIPLKDWKWIPFRSSSDASRMESEWTGQDEPELQQGDPMILLDEMKSQWAGMRGVAIENGVLKFVGKKGARFDKILASQLWRFSLEFKVQVNEPEGDQQFILRDGYRYPAASVIFKQSGRVAYRSAEGEQEIASYETGRWYTVKFEVDLPNYMFNLYLDDEQVVYDAGFQLTYPEKDGYDITYQRGSGGSVHADQQGGDAHTATLVKQIDTLSVRGTEGTMMDDLWGVSYNPGPHPRLRPYTIHTFIDQDFDLPPGMTGWFQPQYDDSKWREIDELPLVFGGERHFGKDLYMRKVVKVGSFEQAFLDIEALDPWGSIYINGTYVDTIGREPARLEVTRYLQPDSDNLIAIRVNHTPKNYYIYDGHTNDDMLWGWFAAPMALDLTGQTRVEDIFVWTPSIEGGDAHTRMRINLKNDAIEPFKGQAVVRFFPWMPEESSEPEAEMRFPVNLNTGQALEIEKQLTVENARLWNWRQPNLYKVQVALEDNGGQPVDDLVVTTGLRTIDQKNGQFRVNGKPEMLNGALSFRFPAPLEKISAWNRCLPNYWIVKEILMVKKLGGNAMRLNGMSSHYADPRCARIADQLGFMYMWCPTGWNRKEWSEGGSYWQGRKNLSEQLEEFVKGVKKVRNHPSIMVWEIFDEGLRQDQVDFLFGKFYPRFMTHDGTRLFLFEKDYVRHEPMTTEGTYGWALDYGREWSALRKWPEGIRDEDCAGRPLSKPDLLKSKTQAYFDTETGELVSQPNWTLVKGKPWYHLHSYEWFADEGNFGRRLTFEEWMESQAWQAFGGYNLAKKQRLYDIDGMLWVVLRGGGNSVTYMKPLIDYYDRAKLAYYLFGSTIQQVFACSGNVDTAHGPDDEIAPVIMNLGPARKVSLRIDLVDMDHQVIGQKFYEDVDLPEGKTVTRLPSFRPGFPAEGHYAIEYHVME